MGHCKVIGFMLSVVLVVGLWAAPAVLADEKPRRGGILNAALAVNPAESGHAPGADLHGGPTAGSCLQ